MTLSAEKPCPICGRAGILRWRPFCSQRCADRDLFRWLNGSYRIPVEPADEDTAEQAPPAGGEES